MIIQEAHHSSDTLEALNSRMVHWSYQNALFARGGDDDRGKSGADQVRTYLAIMHQFVMVEDDKPAAQGTASGTATGANASMTC